MRRSQDPSIMKICPINSAALLLLYICRATAFAVIPLTSSRVHVVDQQHTSTPAVHVTFGRNVLSDDDVLCRGRDLRVHRNISHNGPRKRHGGRSRHLAMARSSNGSYSVRSRASSLHRTVDHTVSTSVLLMKMIGSGDSERDGPSGQQEPSHDGVRGRGRQRRREVQNGARQSRGDFLRVGATALGLLVAVGPRAACCCIVLKLHLQYLQLSCILYCLSASSVRPSC